MQKQSGQKILVVLLIVTLLVAWALDLRYYKTHGEKFIPSFIGRLIHSSEEEPELAEEPPVEKLTVNPNFDGTNKEFVYSTTDDANAVTRIHQTITYQYYDSNGNAIRIIETQTFNAHNTVLYSGYVRSSCKMKDSTVTRQEIEIIYLYDSDVIHRNYQLDSFGSEGFIDKIPEQSDINRT